MNIPLPGTPVRGSETGKPIMAIIDLLGRTWALGILWQLNKRSLTFRGLQEACDGISPTLANTRLKELMACCLVEKGEQGYQLTEQGKSLVTIFVQLGPWSQDWSSELVKQGMINDD